MNDNVDRLYELLPVIYRRRDAEQGYPLQALLRVIAEQVNVVEADMDQLYENWFIETCQDWLVPYLGDLVGYRPVHEAGEPGAVTTEAGRRRNKILIPRREVANTIRYRRRKGTLALLELLANDVAGWPARVVEFYRLLGWTQALNHLRLERGQTVDLRQGEALDRLAGPFDELAHTVDVRRINLGRSRGRSNIPSVGLFIWRLKAYAVTETPAYCLEEVGPRCYTFSVLGNDTPLYNRPQPEAEPTHIAEPLNLPTPIRRRSFEARLVVDGEMRTQASTDYYGQEKSLLIWAPGWPGKDAPQPLSPAAIIPADLSDWQYLAPRNFVAVDPERGRLIFPAKQLPKRGVKVSYHYAFSADIGGGEYQRPLSQPLEAKRYRVGAHGEYERINQALEQWDQDKPDRAVIEITDSGVYVEQINIEFKKENQSLQLRAANRKRPVIRLLDWHTDRPDDLSVAMKPGSHFVLDGLLITGRGVLVQEDRNDRETDRQADESGQEPFQPASMQKDDGQSRPASVTIRHSTLVPGWALQPDCEPRRPAEPSLTLINTRACLVIEHSIVGSIQVSRDEVKTDPGPIHVSDSILDATGADCNDPQCEAVGAPGWPLAHAALTIARSTVFGRIYVHAIDLAENSIFMGQIKVGCRQRGCMRCCYVTPGSKTPRRYHCQPDLVEQAVRVEYEQKRAQVDLTEQDRAALEAEEQRAMARERLRVRPQFNSRRYSTPTYAQLAAACAEEIKRGADDESEMGVFHDLYQPQRAANLRARLDEYLPAGMEAGLIYAS